MRPSDLDALNRQFAIRDRLFFREGPGGLTIAEIRHSGGEATIALHGGHVLSFRPRHHPPVLWLSREARFETGSAIRGGIPVCWPWFADHPSNNAMPAHGFVRATVWTPSASETLADGSTHLKLATADSEETMKRWPHRFRLEIAVSVSDVLRVALTATNTDRSAFSCTGALHSYFNISTPANVRIKGVAGVAYLDKVDRMRRKVQDGDVFIDKETDRIYLDTNAACTIEDRGMQRRIGIAKTGSRTTVIWNPWVEKSALMKDFGDDEYQTMVCVETANAGPDRVRLAPGESHTLEAVICSEASDPERPPIVFLPATGPGDKSA